MTALADPVDSSHATDAAAVELVNVSSSYGRTKVLNEVSLTVKQGGVTALLGPNGAGKTTTLKVVSGLLRPTSGQVRLHGAEVTRTTSYERAKDGICHVPEGRGVYRSLSVRENLTMMSPPRSVDQNIERATATFPILGQRLSQTAGTLSGGEQQMLALMAAYLRNPTVVLVDEPSLGLAPIIVDAVFEFLKTLRAEKVSLLLVDQYATRALAIADDAYVLRRGNIVFAGAAAELRDGNMFDRYIGEGLS
ncbi:ABC transporter ATP-binding protein [Jatrophihabitans sp.]|uniref:ABC transporter ATP-binding protein n=1 Tax=Jatrophihabitans sp. TaxID=1932789 RepID=UPI0030C6B3F2|nr:branched-chain amino acid transporter ATPase [Jatrophihabitans sp.]